VETPGLWWLARDEWPFCLVFVRGVPPHDVVPDAVISRLTELPAHLDKW
jgi:hypothetical protein